MRRSAARLAYDFEGRNSFYENAGSRVVTGPAETMFDPGHNNSRNLRVGLLGQTRTSLLLTAPQHSHKLSMVRYGRTHAA